METGRKKVRLGELLVNSGVITAEQLQQALDNPNRQGKKLGEFLVDEGIVSEDDLAKALSRQLDLDMIDLQSVNVDKEVLNLVPVNVLKKNKIFPFAYKENNFNVLMVAMADPLDYNAIDDINIITNFQVEPVVATTRSIMLAIDKYFGQEEVTEALAAYAKEKKLDVVEDIATEENINSSPIVMLVKDMIEKPSASVHPISISNPWKISSVSVTVSTVPSMRERDTVSMYCLPSSPVLRSSAAWISPRRESRRTAVSPRW